MSNFIGSSLLLPIAILFLLLPHSLSVDTHTQQLIGDICRRTYNYGYCINVFYKNLYKPTMDIKGLAEIAVTQTLLHTSDTLKFIVKSLDSERRSDIRDVYNFCRNSYNSGLSKLTDALLAFAKGDYRNMLILLGTGDRYLSKCQVFNANRVPQLADENGNNRELIQMSLVSGQLILTVNNLKPTLEKECNMSKLTLSSLLFPTVIVFLLIPHCLSVDSDTQELINTICRSTFDYGYCVNVFKNNLYTPTTDIRGLTYIAITQSFVHAKGTLKFVVGLIDSGKNVEWRDLYKICEVTYENMVKEFTDASFAFVREDYRSMLFYIGKCDRFVSDCQSVMGNRVPELTDQNLYNRELIQMSISSGQLIGKIL
ncbi:plant invertase/pectin methylesterase inhibitor [Striga asiatica]|uniref:Plant invertase/pectin methylesterase inhibitor n=1 Tax=Striga asiatica TaxID=4170 RepID=A0A5A7RCQ0_STRAF|nr:plant invertase/pectin methylesterase inhibitor [Striga asiatica]